ncbi:MAG TPA: exo-alpha-sialidase [Caulobacteraceae bacterium]|jgi:predicted neuraminidase
MIRGTSILRLAAALGSMVLLGAAAPAAEITRAEVPSPAGMENHGAAIAELPSGALLVCWYSGLHEEDRSVRILCSRGSPDAAEWSPAWTAVAPGDQAVGARAPNKSLGNVTLTVTPDGRVWMVHGVIQSRRLPVIGEVCHNWVCGRIDARVSADEGHSWSKAHRLVDIGGALPRAELQPVPGGYLAPFYEENQQRTLIAKVTLTGDAAALQGYWRLQGHKLIQPALVRQQDDRFRVYFRDQQRQGVYTARFDPGTGAWSGLTITNLPNPGAAVDAFTDAEGRYVLIYNPSNSNRDVLALARSDDGEHFKFGCDLSLPGAEAGAAYPSVIRGRDGAWRVVYSADAKGRIKVVRFTSGWLQQCFSSQG